MTRNATITAILLLAVASAAGAQQTRPTSQPSTQPSMRAWPLEQVMRAADAGDAAAQDEMAARYVHGTGVPKDFAEANKWYRKAAAAGTMRRRRRSPALHRSRSPDCRPTGVGASRVQA